MITQTVDPFHFVRRAQQIKAQIPILLSQWGLLSNFKRWRLAQDPETGMVVLFGVLNNRYIAAHSATPLGNYFDPRLLRDLEKELQVKVLPSTDDGLRYAFLLEMGNVGLLPAPAQTLEHEPSFQAANNDAPADTDPAILHQRVSRLLKIAEDIEALSNVAEEPEPIEIDKAKFNQQMADYEANPDHDGSKIINETGEKVREKYK